jgi:hypothetical protein
MAGIPPSSTIFRRVVPASFVVNVPGVWGSSSSSTVTTNYSFISFVFVVVSTVVSTVVSIVIVVVAVVSTGIYDVCTWWILLVSTT